MDKEKCGQFGCYGYQDGYNHPQRICGVGGCPDATECSNKLKESIAGKGKDYIMSIFQNKEKGIQARENEAKIKDFEEQEKIRLGKEKMEADEKLKKESEEKTKKDSDELKARAAKVGLLETATKEEIEAKEKDLITVEELKVRAVKAGLPETATLVEVEAKEKEITPPKPEDKPIDGTPNPLDEEKATILVPQTIYDDRCPHCNEIINEKGVYSDDDGKTMRHGACKGKIKITERPKPEENK